MSYSVDKIYINNSNVLRIDIDHEHKLLMVYIKKDSVKNVKADMQVNEIYEKYKSEKYFISWMESGTENPEKVMDKILENEFNRLNNIL